MAALDLQEQEQVDALKHWWKDYGQTIALTIIAGVIGYSGVQGWKAWKQHQATQAAAAFAPFAQEAKAEKPDLKKLNQLADQFIEKNSSSAYAARAALTTAKQAFVAGDLAQAQKRLEWVLANSKEADLLVMARLRLAAVLIDTKKFDQALKTLEAEHAPEYDSLFAETRGDVLAVKGDKAGAKQAYQKAQTAADPSRKMALDWKLQALGA